MDLSYTGRLVLLLTILLVIPAAAGAQAPRPEIWFQPNSTYDARTFATQNTRANWSRMGSDFWTLFSDNADAVSLARIVQVVKFSPALIAQAKPVELKRIFGWLKLHNIDLAVGVGVLPTDAGSCGRGVEGYSANLDSLIAKIARNEGNPKYVFMDEPFYFGTQATGPHACHSSVQKVAEQVANSVRAIRNRFPGVRIGDAEPIPLAQDLGKWLDAYEAAVGEPLDFFIADVLWKQPWRTPLEGVASLLEQKHTRLGIIFNGSPTAKTGAEWVRDALEHAQLAESDPRLRIDIALFQSWMPYPVEMLPSGREGTMANLISRYIAGKSKSNR